MTVVLAFFWRFIWPVLKFAIPLPVFVILSIVITVWIYNATSIHSAVRDAVTGYVHSAQVDALEASAAEKQRQLVAVRQALTELRAKLAADAAAEALAEPQRQKDDNAYDAQDKAGACSPTLSDSDIEFLRKP